MQFWINYTQKTNKVTQNGLKCEIMKYDAIKAVLSPEFRSVTGLKTDELFILVWLIENNDMPYTKNDILAELGIRKTKLYDTLTKYKKLNIIQDIKLPINIINIYKYLYSFYSSIGNIYKNKENEIFRVCGKTDAVNKDFFRVCGKMPDFTGLVPPSHTLPPIKIPRILDNNYINNLYILKYLLLYNFKEKEKKEITPFIPLKKKMKEIKSSSEVDKKFDEILQYINSHNADIWRENFTRRFKKNPASVIEKFKCHVIGNCRHEELFQMNMNKILVWIYNSANLWINQNDSGEIKTTTVTLGVGEYIKDCKRYYKRGDKIKEVPIDAPARLDDKYEWVDGKWVYFGYWN